VWIGAQKRCRVQLVHVYSSDDPPRGADEARASILLDQERARLQRLVDRARQVRARLDSKLLRGEPYVELIRHARDTGASLIVVGCKGAGASPGKVLGRTAARLARMADTPLLAVRNPARGAYRRPLVALPLDPSARRLIRLAERLSAAAARPLPAIRTYHVPFPGLIDAGSERDPSPYHEEFRARAQKELRAQLASLARHGVKVRPLLRPGDPRATILAEAARLKADLIALGTHARSGLAHMLLGSVAEWVLVNASADVLVARPVRFTFESP
jgi:nucleotide-binding universal stress UspA family protein